MDIFPIEGRIFFFQPLVLWHKYARCVWTFFIKMNVTKCKDYLLYNRDEKQFVVINHWNPPKYDNVIVLILCILLYVFIHSHKAIKRKNYIMLILCFYYIMRKLVIGLQIYNCGILTWVFFSDWFMFFHINRYKVNLHPTPVSREEVSRRSLLVLSSRFHAILSKPQLISISIKACY